MPVTEQELLDESFEIVTAEEIEERRRQLRALVEAGGNPFIRLVFDENGQARVDAVGFAPESIPTVLREVADLIESQL
jgi:hypothetical protein